MKQKVKQKCGYQSPLSQAVTSHKIICVPQRPKGKIQAAPLQIDTKSMESRLWVDWTSSWVFDIYDWLCGHSQSRTEISFFSLSLKYKQCLHEWTDPLCLHMQSRLSDCSVNSRLAALKVSPTFQIGHVLPLDIRPLQYLLKKMCMWEEIMRKEARNKLLSERLHLAWGARQRKTCKLQTLKMDMTRL